MTWTGMDSLINNHYPFLPDLNWSNMLSVSRHKQLNVHCQILVELKLTEWMSEKRLEKRKATNRDFNIN